MKRALINFSFDDGRRDNFEIAYPILKQYDCPAFQYHHGLYYW